MGRHASAQRQPRCQPRPRLSTRRLSAASVLRHEVREEPVGTGGEVGLGVCKLGGRAAGETGDEAACIAAPAPAGAGRRQPAEPAAAGEAGCSLQDRCRPAWPAPGSMCYPPTGRIGRRRPARQGASSVVRGRRVQVAVTKPEAAKFCPPRGRTCYFRNTSSEIFVTYFGASWVNDYTHAMHLAVARGLRIVHRWIAVVVHPRIRNSTPLRLDFI